MTGASERDVAPRRGSPLIVLIGTLDTKGPEIAYVRDRIRHLGAEAIVVDSGILGDSHGIVADISRAEVAAAGGHALDEVRTAGSRGAAVELMSKGVRAVCLQLRAKDRLDGALCLGGAEGAILGAVGMRALPLGVPKLIVSPSASGRRQFAPFTGESDILVMHSVVDILGLNPIARAVFDNAAAAVVGMARDAGRTIDGFAARTVGITMLGQTTPGAMRLLEQLTQAGHEPVVFHANGVGGPAMEKLIADGSLSGIVDFTLSELGNSLMDGIHATGPERLRVAGRHGLPQVVVPGCVDFFNQGVPVSARYRERKLYYHNPVATLVRLEPDEMSALAGLIAERLNEATGPVRVVAPLRGFSLSGIEGGALWDPEGDLVFIDALESSLRSGIELERVDADVNDPRFADIVAARYLSLVKKDSVV